MRSSRIARQAARIVSAAAVTAVLLGAVGTTPAHAARNIKGTSTGTVTMARNISN